MLEKIIHFSIRNKLIVILFTLSVVAFGLFAVIKIPVGTVPDITNNQVQVITTSGNLSTQEIEQFITAPLEMALANLPGVEEIRSISKFGISLITVVFNDNMGTYLPRQLIAEKLKSAAEDIPDNYGTPEMGPISTGLGEIYQYILDVQPGYEDQYSPMDLRTIQDWIVKRRLSGIPGVVEVNSWGGFLKEYEIAIDPYRLQSLNLSLMDVFNALAHNNSSSGGAYIEKDKQSYFIRGDGQVNSISDLEHIVIASHNDVPIYIRDVATVRFGHANRYGAITANGKGETILGQVMMLKDANSKEVIQAVKERVSEVQKNLPEGVFINPVLERGELIEKTSHTVAENLIFGALIVFLIVLLLLGNIRSALVIASMIPLALLFTLSMMYIFGIDANLMSLGALDFGIIIDGAVIIVEFIMLQMASKANKLRTASKEEAQSMRDKLSLLGSTKMMQSAIFGQVIILIVFIPILSLQGVEGKMFRPMALAFSFALLGAMLMGLTWLPVAASIFLKPGKDKRRNLSRWLLDKLYASYYPVIKWSCGHKRVVLGLAFMALLFTAFLFTRIGGEFVPTLDEGDFVIQPALKTGTSLSETIETTTRMENILLRAFPHEVDQIVCRIGAAEVPTDPMSMEEIDMIIKLHPKKHWTQAHNKEELAELFKEALEVLPDIEYEFTQPIEMRFNELITGVRADIAVKLYGDNLDYINQKAEEIKALINDVPGASDVILEKTTGLPQIRVRYKRERLAYYNMDIETLNTYLSTAFGGAKAGFIFEGEKRFDLVLRLPEAHRTDIGDIQNLYVQTPTKGQVPLAEFASITYAEGPAKISRDNTQRRVVVSVNVRDRDLKSVIEDIQQRISANIQLQPGNYIVYGGQFENLQNATKRLLVAVPVALLLIFIFLHFAFQSFKDALMIFTAIPLATVGGVVLLWLRGMPFSVSAGVGFIALFGIAILNGIVLIEHFKDLQAEGLHDMRSLIIQGTRDRLRPVLLTAGAAAMGFLPMAISTGAGAEVQRPLATVVIGGLVSSTLLTMIALPLLFEIFYNVVGISLFPLRFIRSKALPLLVVLFFIPRVAAQGQTPVYGLPELTQLALENNLRLQAFALQAEQAEAGAKGSIGMPKTYISYSKDENNVAANGYPLNVWGIQQDFAFPTLYAAKKELSKEARSLADIRLQMEQNKVLKQVASSYMEYTLLSEKLTIYQQLDSLYQKLLQQYEMKRQHEDATPMDYLQIKSRQSEMAMECHHLQHSRSLKEKMLRKLLHTEETFTLKPHCTPLALTELSDSLTQTAYWQQQSAYLESQIKVARQAALPDISLHYFIGSNGEADAQRYQGFEVGLALPLFYGSQRNQIREAELAAEAQKFLIENEAALLAAKRESLLAELEHSQKTLTNYQETELPLARQIKRSALKAYQLHEMDYLHFSNSMETVLQIELAYYEAIYHYNLSYLNLLYFTND